MTKKKKAVILVAVIAFALLLCAVYLFLIKPQIPPKPISLSANNISTENVNLIAHRGFSAKAPENTEASFVEAGKAGFFAAECDIQLSKDNVWVVNHNADIDKMTDGTGKISDLTYDEISKFTVDNGYHLKEHTGQHLITLDRYLEICNEYNIVPQIEVKEGNYTCLEDILTALDKFDGMREKAIIISFDGVILEKLRNLDEDIQLWYLTQKIEDKTLRLAKLNNYTIAFNHKNCDENMVHKAQEQNINLSCWTVDSVKTYEYLYSLGIRNFTTNRLTY